MKQLVQNIKNGQLATLDLPEPIVAAGEVLIANQASLISAGTEKSVINLARKSLVGKALARPDHVRRVLVKMKNEGVFETFRQVSAKLEEPMALGYSSSGTVLACGDGVYNVKPGDRVASNGPHAAIVSVPKNLVAFVPPNVSYEEACFGVVGSIALQGVRRAEVSIGETALVIGLGLIGQLATLLLQAAGVRVIAVDPSAERCKQARDLGFTNVFASVSSEQVLELTRGNGVDCALITAATASNQPIELAADAVRRRGRVVLVGVTGLNIPREPFYHKEIEFTVSCSYGPGRYDSNYEQDGIDYPFGFVRWTEQRNIQAVVDLIAAGRLNVQQLITHRFGIESANEAYALIESASEPHVGVILEYQADSANETSAASATNSTRSVRARAHAAEKTRVAVIGAGNFARLVMLPQLMRCKDVELQSIVSARGLNANSLAKAHGFENRHTDISGVFESPDIDAVFLLTRPDLHCEQVINGLRAGKNIFVEKPMAISTSELLRIQQAVAELGPECGVLMTGFNRRFSEACTIVRDWFDGVSSPLTLTYRMNVGTLPADSWVHRRASSGGRLVSEACHAVDTATFLLQSVPQRIYAECIGGPNAPEVTDDQALLTMRHQNGSVSSVAYLAGGDRAMPKERIEVLGGGRMAVIDDFRLVTLARDGRVTKHRTNGKGHAEEIDQFVASVRSGASSPIPFDAQFAVHAATLLAERSLRDGLPWDLGKTVGGMHQALQLFSESEDKITAA